MTGTLIVALDFDHRREAEALIAQLGAAVTFYKIGYQLAYGGDGLALGRDLLAQGKKVFFDLKLLDIDNTVEQGVNAIAATGANMLTVHAYPATMRAAAKVAKGSGLCVLGVSVLTSMNDDDLKEAGFALDTAALVALRAQQARDAGIGGLVCSPLEVAAARKIAGPGMALVTPGIRPSGAALNDQRRVMGPAEALKAGSTHLVVGRPITAAPDPNASALAILAEMGSALAPA